jgi:hypothetical protein
MLSDLDKTLKTLLERELAHFEDAVSISFDTPDDTFKPTKPAVDFFLYDVRENRDLRSSEWLTERHTDGRSVQKRAPTRVDCSYLITAWAGDADSEHALLGEVMKVLLRHPTIPEQVLEESLKGQGPPLPAVTLQPGRLQSLGEFWQALGGKPKAALNYTVTIGVETEKPVELGPPVIDKRLKFRHGVGEA